jgi:hypothetical protein
VNVAKGRQYSVYTVAPQSQRWSLGSTLDLDSDYWGYNNSIMTYVVYVDSLDIFIRRPLPILNG